MTVGSPIKKIILFAFPMLIGNIAQQLYSTVDSIVVGKYVGDNALADYQLLKRTGVRPAAFAALAKYRSKRQNISLRKPLNMIFILLSIYHNAHRKVNIFIFY